MHLIKIIKIDAQLNKQKCCTTVYTRSLQEQKYAIKALACMCKKKQAMALTDTSSGIQPLIALRTFNQRNCFVGKRERESEREEDKKITAHLVKALKINILFH